MEPITTAVFTSFFAGLVIEEINKYQKKLEDSNTEYKPCDTLDDKIVKAIASALVGIPENAVDKLYHSTEYQTKLREIFALGSLDNIQE